MGSGTLYDYPDSFRSFKALIAAEYSGFALTLDKSFKFGETNKSADFLKKFPLGKVPAFESSDGNKLFESNAIAYFVANEVLRGASAIDAALVQQYINFADNEILPSASVWTFPTLGLRPYNKQDTENAIAHLKSCFALLNDALLTRTFLVGERVTLADISVCCNLLLAFKQVLDPGFRASYVNVSRWFLTCINQPQFKKFIGDFTWCSKMATFDAKKFNELYPKEKKPEKKKKEEPKVEKPKVEKPKVVEKKEEVAAPPKPKDPFAELPPSNFVLDEWKRMFSNNEASVYMPWLWEHIDTEGYSFWLGEYMYNDELELGFMANNLVGGMFQRLDKLSKNGFANVVVFGEGKEFKISGVWLFRGQKLAFELNPDWQTDYDSYKFTKLDPNSPEGKKTITDYFGVEGEVTEKPIHATKTFK